MRERTEFFQKRTPLEIIATAVLFFRRHAGALIGGLLVIAGPILVLSTVFFSWYWAELGEMTDPEQIVNLVSEAASEPAYYIVGFTSLLAQVVLAGAAYVFMVLYVENDAAPLLSEWWSRFVTDVFTVLSTAFFVVGLFLLLVMLNVVPCLGTIVFVISILYGATMLMPVFVLRLWERASLGATIARCAVIVKPYFVDTLLVFVLSTAVYVVLLILLTIPATLLATAFQAHVVMTHVITVMMSLAGSFVLLFPIIVSGLHSFNLLHREVLNKKGGEGSFNPDMIS